MVFCSFDKEVDENCGDTADELGQNKHSDEEAGVADSARLSTSVKGIWY